MSITARPDRERGSGRPAPEPPLAQTGAGPVVESSGAGVGRAQLARLFALVRILQSERFPNARELAERCEVSRRTIHRDLDMLSASGVPVVYRPEREGYQLARGFALPGAGVAEVEALALLVLSRGWTVGEGLGLLRHACSGAVKLAQSLPDDARARVLAAAEPFDDAPGRSPAADSPASPDRRAVHDAILDALSRGRQMRLWYVDRASGARECTKMSLYRLLLHDRHWFLVGRSSLHRRVVTIGVPWVEKVAVTDDRSTIPPRFHLERYLGSAWGARRDGLRHNAVVRFAARVAPELNDAVWHSSQRRVDLPDGQVELHFVVEGLDDLARWVLGFGDAVEVLQPRELVAEIFRQAVVLARAHRPRGGA
jgi:predicted DNA-binding transcriptional regulator YafY